MNIQYVQRIEHARSYDAKSVARGAMRDRYREKATGKSPATKALNELLPLDYMGSAEFEFGAVGDALRAMCEHENERFEFRVSGGPRTGLYTGQKEHGKAPEPSEVELWGVGIAEHAQAVQEWFVAQAKGISTGWMKEPAYVQDALWGVARSSGAGADKKIVRSRVTAWLDIENHWFASADREQYEGFCHIFWF